MFQLKIFFLNNHMLSIDLFLYIEYWGINRNRGGSIFVVFVGSPPHRIYYLDENTHWKSSFCY